MESINAIKYRLDNKEIFELADSIRIESGKNSKRPQYLQSWHGTA